MRDLERTATANRLQSDRSLCHYALEICTFGSHRYQPHPGLGASGAAIKRRTRAGNRRTNLWTSICHQLCTKSYIDMRPAHFLTFIYFYNFYICKFDAPHPFDSLFAPSLQFLQIYAVFDPRLKCLHNSDSLSGCWGQK